MNLSEIRSDIYSQIDEETTSTYITSTELNRWINQAQSIINRKTREIKSSTTLTSTASTASYALPSDCLSIERVFYDGEHIHKATWPELDELGLTDSSAGTGVPDYYVRRGGYLYLYPVPSTSSLNIVVTYIARPATLSDDSDEPEIDEEEHELLVLYSIYKFRLKDEEYTESLACKELFDKGLKDAVAYHAYGDLDEPITFRVECYE